MSRRRKRAYEDGYSEGRMPKRATLCDMCCRAAKHFYSDGSMLCGVCFRRDGDGAKTTKEVPQQAAEDEVGARRSGLARADDADEQPRHHENRILDDAGADDLRLIITDDRQNVIAAEDEEEGEGWGGREERQTSYVVEGNRFRHCFERAAQRYGLTITRKDLRDIELWIVAQRPKILECTGRIAVVIPFQGQKVVVGFDAPVGKILTFLPPGPREKSINLISGRS